MSSQNIVRAKPDPRPVNAEGGNRFRVDLKLAAISAIVLLACLFYPVVYALWYIDPGFNMNTRWKVIDITLCELNPDLCNRVELEIQLDDQIISIGELSYEDYENNRNLAIFSNISPGESVLITLNRDGIQQSIDWAIPESTLSEQLERLITPLLIYGPFWLAGTVILLFMQPHNVQWRLLVVFNYLTAFWLSVGVISGVPILYSSLLLHAVSWLLLPVFLHFHMVVPSPIKMRHLRGALISLYTIAIVMAVLELVQALPRFLYMFSIILAALGSIGLLAYRSYGRNIPAADRVASRLMLAGIVLAFGPGIIIWLMPVLLETRTPGEISTTVALLAVPMLPLFYTYAIYKRRLGIFEVRLNQLLSVYALFIVYLLILTIATQFGSGVHALSGQVYGFYLIVLMAIALAVLPIQHQFRRLVNKLAYGAEFDPNDLFSLYAGEISAAVDRESLVQLLANEITPPFGIRQSALLTYHDGEFHSFYERNTPLSQRLVIDEDFGELMSDSGVYRPLDSVSGSTRSRWADWVRLALLLRRRSDTVGLWLFGRRDPDDFYSQTDINILVRLADQVAISIENMRLIETVQSELAVRRRTEEKLKSHAERLLLIHEIDRAVLEVNSPKDIAQAALASLKALIPFSRASVMIYQADRKNVELLAVSGRAEEDLGPSLQMPIGLFAMREDLERGVVWLMDDLSQLANESPIVEAFLAEGLSSVLSAPLTASGKLIGSLNLASVKPAGFSSIHKDIAREVANSLAVVLHTARLLEKVTHDSVELQKLSARLIKIQEEERKQISYELHDEIGQVLTAITYNLATIRRDLPAEVRSAMEDRLSDMESLVLQVMDRIRSMSLELRPSMLHDLGLIPTLRWYINQYGNRLNSELVFRADEIDGRLPDVVETTIYRVVQEGVTNAVRHSGADNVCVSLESNDGLIRAIVEDDGVGFEVDGAFSFQASRSGTGLLGIRERVASIGGRVDIQSEHGRGTKLVIEVPVDYDNG